MAMQQQQQQSFDANQYYRFSNAALGGTAYSLDVLSRATGAMPTGELTVAASGPYAGQAWQVLEAPDRAGRYLLSTQWLGAKRKLDAAVNARGDLAPMLREYTNTGSNSTEQTWSLTPWFDAAANRTLWSVAPDFVDARLVMSVYSDDDDGSGGGNAEPYLATPASGDDSDERQWWTIDPQNISINDATYSASHLPALATETAILPVGVTETTSTPAASISDSSSINNSASKNDSASDDQDDTSGLAGPLIAAAVLPTVAVAVAVGALLFFICMRRRKLRRMAENNPYPQYRDAHKGSSGHDTMVVVSEILETFVDPEPGINSKKDRPGSPSPPPPSSTTTKPPFFSSGVLSSNCSWLAGESAVSVTPRVSPLSVPPPLRGGACSSEKRQSRYARERPVFFGASALGLQEERAECAVTTPTGHGVVLSLEEDTRPAATTRWSGSSEGSTTTSERAMVDAWRREMGLSDMRPPIRVADRKGSLTGQRMSV